MQYNAAAVTIYPVTASCYPARPRQTVECMADRSRLLDLFVPAGCAVAGVLMFSEQWQALGGAMGGVIGGGLRWLVGSETVAKHVSPKTPSSSSRRDEGEVLSSLPVALLTLDDSGVVTSATPEALRLLARQVEGQHISIVFRTPSILAAVDAALNNGTTDSFDFRVNRPRQMILTATIRVLPPGGQGRIVVMLEDNTSRVRIEDARSDFVANASHELRTPLAAISGLVETLQGPAKNDPEAQEKFLALIAKQTRRMTRLANDLLSLSRIEADENILPTAEQDIVAILDDALAAIEPVAKAEQASVEPDIPPSLPKVHGSRDELTQVFVNLIENAIKYAGESSPVRVSARIDGSDLRVSVADDGPGIAPEDIPRITERFYRVDPADSRARGGTGLGLAIVKHIVSRHRGSLDIVSELGNGTEFTVTLPIVQSVERLNELAAQPPQS